MVRWKVPDSYGVSGGPLIVAFHENRFDGSVGAAERPSIGSLVRFSSSFCRRLLV